MLTNQWMLWYIILYVHQMLRKNYPFVNLRILLSQYGINNRMKPLCLVSGKGMELLPTFQPSSVRHPGWNHAHSLQHSPKIPEVDHKWKNRGSVVMLEIQTINSLLHHAIHQPRMNFLSLVKWSKYIISPKNKKVKEVGGGE